MRDIGKYMQAFLLLFFCFSAALAYEPRFSSDGDTLYTGSLARVKALALPPLESNGGLLASGGMNSITGTVWGPEVRLTFITDSTHTSTPPFATVYQDTLFVSFALSVIWGDAPFLISSFDNGENWSDIWCITNEDTAQAAWHRFINFYEHRLTVEGVTIWSDEFDRTNIYTKYSDDLGVDWSEPHFFFSRGQHFVSRLGGTSNGDTLMLGLFHQRDHDDRRVDTLKTAYSVNNGENWSELRGGIPLYDNFYNYLFWLRYSLGRVHLLYQDSSSVENLTEVFYAFSEDWGESWVGPVVISDDSCQHSQWPYLYASPDGKLIATWFDYKYGYGGGGFTGDILYRISTDNGDTWGEELQLTDHHLATASRTFIQANHLGVLWQDHRTGFFVPEFYYTESLDFGETWSQELRLTDAAGYTGSPDLHLANGYLYLFYDDARDNPPFGEEIYFRRAEITQTLIEGKGPPCMMSLALNCYPNPFNSSVNLLIEGTEGGQAEIDIYDMTGRLLKKMNLNTKEGTIRTTWDATDALGNKVSSGIYFARVETARGISTAKLIYIK